ncbi:MAG TPA: transglycosylase SLT domain-containing protein [Opitutaceae bacterium]
MRPLILASLLVVARAPGVAQTPELPSADEIAELGEALLEAAPPEVKAEVEQAAGKELTAAAQTVERALDSGSLEDLAELRPQVEAALQAFGQISWARPYVEWLLERADYLDVATQALAAAQKEPAVDPTQPAPRSPAPELRRQRATAIIRSRAVWRERVAKRPVPARASEFMPRAKEIFTDEGVPPEWVWLAEVESAWNPAARSPVGALGLFQFMPATAERFGLQLTPEDERTHAEKSARAAARYLRTLYRRFESWPLALAAYNAGEGRVGRLLAKSEAKTFDGIADALPAETQMYVPKVFATVAVREGIEPETLPPPRA